MSNELNYRLEKGFLHRNLSPNYGMTKGRLLYFQSWGDGKLIRFLIFNCASEMVVSEMVVREMVVREMANRIMLYLLTILKEFC